MRAILLAAGYGTRLKPLTNSTPKCLMPIGKKPLLQIWLERLNEVGVKHFLINTHYLADQVNSFVKKTLFHDQITIVHEPQLMGTAGTLMHNLDFFQGEDGMLIHADNYCLADFKAFVNIHRNRPPECSITMMTFRTPTPSSCGIVIPDQRGVVVEFHEKPKLPKDNLANGAIYLLSKEFLKQAPQKLNGVIDFSTHVLPQFIDRICTYETSAPLIDIGSLQGYKEALIVSTNTSTVKKAK